MFKIKKNEAIRLQPSDEREFTSIEDFLNHFYKTQLPYTYYSSKTLPTYYVNIFEYDNTTLVLQCSKNRLRSPRDLAMLIKYYFPDASYVDILKEIVTFAFIDASDKSVVRVLQFRTCGDIQSANIQTWRAHKAHDRARYYAAFTYSPTTLTYKGAKTYNWQKILDYIGLTTAQIADIVYEKALLKFNPNL